MSPGITTTGYDSSVAAANAARATLAAIDEETPVQLDDIALTLVQ